MLEDSHGGLWFAGCEVGAEGLFYFDGSRFLSPLQAPFPKVVVSGMEQDSNGGIWIASSAKQAEEQKSHQRQTGTPG